MLNWLERLGARRVAIDLQDSSLPQVDLRFLASRHPEIQVHPWLRSNAWCLPCADGLCSGLVPLCERQHVPGVPWLRPANGGGGR